MVPSNLSLKMIKIEAPLASIFLRIKLFYVKIRV